MSLYWFCISSSSKRSKKKSRPNYGSIWQSTSHHIC